MTLLNNHPALADVGIDFCANDGPSLVAFDASASGGILYNAQTPVPEKWVSQGSHLYLVLTDVDVVELPSMPMGFSKAVRFGGSSSRADLSRSLETVHPNPTVGAVSFELWVRPDTDGLPEDAGVVLWESGGDADGSSLILRGGRLTYRVRSGSDATAVQVSATLPPGNQDHFYQIVTVWDPAQDIALYIDGALVANASGSGPRDWTGGNHACLGVF